MAMSSSRMIWQLSRTFSCSCFLRSKEAQGRFMMKLLSNKLDRKLQQTHSARHAVKLLDKKKTAILSKSYMENVTQALAFGGFEEVAEKGIQVTRVSVRNTGTVDVYWLANENEDPSQIQNMLTSLSRKVASKLMYGNMMGCVPHLLFKRDLASLYMVETEKRFLQIAKENEIYETLMEHEKLVDAEAIQDTVSDSPLMRMDVFGLPHDKILRRIKYGMKNSHFHKVPTPPSSEELLRTHSSLSIPQSRLKDAEVRQRELKKFIAAYQKSSLSSSACRHKDQNLGLTDIYYEDNEDDANELYHDGNFDEDWEEDDEK